MGSAVRNGYGFRRTTCACASCANNCRLVPGYLLPEDIPQMARRLGYADLGEFARDNLLASPGALALKEGQLIRIRTLVPQRGAGGACKFLTKESLCRIHDVAPFACAFFDEHEPQELSDWKRNYGLVRIAREWQKGGLYSRLWLQLDADGLRSPAPEEARGITPEEIRRRVAAALAHSS